MPIESFFVDITGSSAGLIRAAGEGEAAAGSLESRLGKVGGSMGMIGSAANTHIGGTAVKNVSLLDRAFGGVLGSVKGVVGGMLSMVGQTAGIGALFGGGAFLVEGVKYAQQYNEQMALLAAAYRNVGQSVPTAAIDEMQKKMQTLGFTEDASNASLLKLAQAHIPVSQQMHVMSVASDLARAKGLDLASAMELLLRAAQGTGRGLIDLGINLPIVIPKAKALQSATDALTKAQQAYHLALDKYGQYSAKTVAAHEKLDAATAKVALDTKEMSNHFSQMPTVLGAIETRLGGAATAYKKANPFVTMGADIQAIARAGGQVLLPFLDQLASTVSKNEPAIASFVKNGVQFLATAAKDAGGFIANDLYPPVKDLIGFVVDHKTVFEAFAGTLTAMWALGKVKSVGGSVIDDLKMLNSGKGMLLNLVHALTGLGSGSSGSGVAGTVTSAAGVRVFVTNWEMMGGGGGGGGNVLGDVAKGGGLGASIASGLTAGLAAAGAGVIAGDVVLALNKGKGSSVLDTSNAARQSGPGAARWGAVIDQQTSSLADSWTTYGPQIRTSLAKSGESAANVKKEMSAIDAAVLDGQVKTQSQLKTFETYWESANLGIKNSAANLATLASLTAGIVADARAAGNINLAGLMQKQARTDNNGVNIHGDVHIALSANSPADAAAAVRNSLLLLQRRGAINKGTLS